MGRASQAAVPGDTVLKSIIEMASLVALTAVLYDREVERWEGGALLFGFINAFQFYCQAAGFTVVPGYVLRMLPYLFTIGVLVIITRWKTVKKRLGAPAALGILFEREQ